MRAVSAAVLSLAIGAVGLTAIAGAAGAQQGPPCDPQAYGCPPPPPPRPTEPTITVRPPQAQAGTVVGVDACGYRPADSGLTGSITFDGQVVLVVTLDDNGCLRPGQPANGLSNSFVVPNRPQGSYQVCATFPGYPAACMSFRVFANGNGGNGNARVQSDSTSRDLAADNAAASRPDRVRDVAAVGAVVVLGAVAVLALTGGRARLRRP